MAKPKKNTGNQNPQKKPIETSEKGKHSGAHTAGDDESSGGSRDGNAGHSSDGNRNYGTRR